jgi:hypothetical protein
MALAAIDAILGNSAAAWEERVTVELLEVLLRLTFFLLVSRGVSYFRLLRPTVLQAVV